MKPVEFVVATERDLPLIEHLHAQQNEKNGTTHALPKLFTPLVPIVLIGYEGRTPVQALYVELVPELRFAGCDPKATAHSRREAGRIFYALQSMGHSGVQCKVPNDEIGEMIRKPLEEVGFKDETAKFLHFYKQFESFDGGDSA